MTKSDKIRLFRKRFRGRQDIVPRHWKSAKTGRGGYSPLCRKEWHRSECTKGIRRMACSLCMNADYARLSDSLIHDHFAGKHILGVYPLLTDHRCYFVAADFDGHQSGHQTKQNPLNDVRAFYETCQMQDIPCHILGSKSGNGYHVFVFFEETVPAWKARVVAFALLQEAGVIGEDTDISSFDRLFPNQDRLSGKGFGNLIALPFQGKAVKKGNTLFLNPDTAFEEPFTDQWKILMSARKCNESMLDNLICEWHLTRSADSRCQASRTYSSSGFPGASPASDFEQIAARCAFIAHCRDDAETLPEPEWFILLTISGRCVNGEKLSHTLSEPYPDYSYEETEAKIHHALYDTGPYCCETIKRTNRKYCSSCEYHGIIRSPIVLGRAEHSVPTNQSLPGSDVHYRLTEGEKDLIRRHYVFYHSLDKGLRIPGTEKQKRFESVCRGLRAPRNLHEWAYFKYKSIQSAKHRKHYGEAVFPEDQKVGERLGSLPFTVRLMLVADESFLQYLPMPYRIPGPRILQSVHSQYPQSQICGGKVPFCKYWKDGFPPPAHPA